MSVNLLAPTPLSNLLGAHDVSDFVPEVVDVSPTSPALVRGAVVCKLASGKVTLAGAEASTAAQAYGIVLDASIDPTVQPTPTATVARSGVFNAVYLSVDPSVQLSAFADQLRLIGIFVEQLANVGVVQPV
jgi:hypothetical protein